MQQLKCSFSSPGSYPGEVKLDYNLTLLLEYEVAAEKSKRGASVC